MKKSAGVTLIELLVVVSIISVLVVVLGFSYQGWTANYKVESQTKELYADLMDARLRAMHRNRVHFVKLESTRYTIYEDTNPAPDGNNTLDTTDTKVIEKNTAYDITYALGGGYSKFKLDKDGTSSLDGRIRLGSLASPEYDCIVLFSTRINLGKWDDKGTADPHDDKCIAK